MRCDAPAARRFVPASTWGLVALLAGLSLFCWPVLAAEDEGAARTISVSYDFSTPTVSFDQGRTIVVMSGCANTGGPGEPLLPVRTGRILLPQGTTVAGVALSTPMGLLTLTNALRTTGREKPPGGRTRPQRVELASVQRMLGCDIAVLRLFPVRYDSAPEQLQFAPRLVVTLTLAPSSVPSVPLRARVQAAARESVSAWIDNPDLVSGFDKADPGREVSDAAYDYLLVTRERLLAAFKPLVEEKRRRGLSVKAETMEAIIALEAGRDDAEKLRNHIRRAWTNWGVKYVLLGGDVSTVPCRYAYVPRKLSERECLVPSDLYFACLDGSWNRDRDRRWGEPADGDDGGEVDLLPEVVLGRVPVDTAEEAAIFVAKTIAAEEASSREETHALLAGAFLEQGAAQGGAMFDPLLPALRGFSTRFLDDRPHTSPQWEGSDVLPELNAGPRLVLYSGHATSDSLMRLSLSDLGALTNKDSFLLCSVGCNAGQFDNDPLSPDSIGEEFVKRQGGGAFAAVLNSRLGWYDARQEWKYSGEFMAGFLGRLTKGRGSLGEAFQQGLFDILGQVEASGGMTYRLCYYSLTLLGDPSLPFNTAENGNTPLGN